MSAHQIGLCFPASGDVVIRPPEQLRILGRVLLALHGAPEANTSLDFLQPLARTPAITQGSGRHATLVSS